MSPHSLYLLCATMVSDFLPFHKDTTTGNGGKIDKGSWNTYLYITNDKGGMQM